MYLQLINSDKKVKLCRSGFSYLKKSQLDKGWRLHSAGYAVLQFTRFGRIKTLYMHKVLAAQFLESSQEQDGKRYFVRMKNADKLDCRLENLEWSTMAGLRRQQHITDGYRGVSKDGNKYRAVLYDNGERVYLGMYDTAEQAAEAYDKESFRRFGLTKSLNGIGRFATVEQH